MNVVVTTPGGSGAGTGVYTYVTPAPTVTAVAPSSGTTLGGTSVTITGTNFTGATAVTFGGTAATGVTVVSATSITATTLAHAVGVVNVVVTTPGGSGTGTGVYTYVTPAPTVTAVAPSSGTTLGGTSVTITGTNFTGATAVTFGGTAATGVTVVSATSITATTPAHAVGVVNVVVTTPGGSGTGTGVYTYVTPAPTVTAVAPSSGTTLGGTSVTITGTNFTGATAVTFGGTAATGVTVVSATSITATTPAHAVGVVNVVVTTPGGSGTGTGVYTYVTPAPTVTAVAPSSGTTLGGTSVTITGTNFTGATAVTFGGAAATGVTVVSATSITATTPAGTAGTASVLVTTPGGTNAANSLYTYVTPAPTVTAVAPSSGTTLGGTSVTITGTNFTGATAVTFGGAAATGVTVVSATSITATTPAHAVGVVNVVVTTPGGSGTGSGLYTFVILVTSIQLTSSVNPAAAGTPVTFTATITSGSGTPTGILTFKDGATIIGTATLAGGVAVFTTSALTVGTHSITAIYAGNFTFAGSTSAALAQTINVPADSEKLRSLQVAVTPIVAQSSGQAITGAIDSAISEGFSDSQQLISPSGSGFRFNFTADTDRDRSYPAQAVRSFTPEPEQPKSRIDDAFSALAYTDNFTKASPPEPEQLKSRTDDAFSALAYTGNFTKASPPHPQPREWLAWADVRTSGIEPWGAAGATPLYGIQFNALMGLTHKLSSNLLVGVLGGYEIFDYRYDALNGRLKGDGWTVGSYLGWKFLPGLRFDAASAYSVIGYDGVAGTALGTFSGNRWLVSSGLTGTYKANGFEIEPSAKIYALWERENAYTDSLGTAQAESTFTTGRASGGVKLIYPFAWTSSVGFAPYVGFYADYYFTGENAAVVAQTGAVPLASLPILDGWSARATGGLAARFANGAIVTFGGELGGIGSNTPIWTFRGRASVPF